MRLVRVPEKTVPSDGGGVTEAEGENDGGDMAVGKGRRETEDDR